MLQTSLDDCVWPHHWPDQLTSPSRLWHQYDCQEIGHAGENCNEANGWTDNDDVGLYTF